jgi:RNA polymerase sigma-70 factor (ECF subfamily)
MEGASDADLANALVAGDVEALARLYDRYGPLAYAVALRVVGDPGRAEDVVQDCFLKLWGGAHRFDSSRGSLRTWLLTTVRNRAIDYLRGRAGREAREMQIPVDAEASGVGSEPWREVALGIERDMIRDGVDSLPTDQRQVVELAYFSGYTYREIAEMVQVPLSTVKGRMRLALEKLHSYLQGRGLTYGT